MSAFAAIVGTAIGLSVGAMGSGGSILTVPALVYIFGLSATQATAASLLAVGITSALGTGLRALKHLVQWKTGLAFGFLGIAGSIAGSRFNRIVSEDYLLLGFGCVMAVAAFAFVHRLRSKTAPPEELGQARWSLIVIAASVVGFITGLFGVGGGFLVVPALVITLNYSMPVAAATSMLVIAFNCAVAGVDRVGTVDLPWALIGPFSIAMIVGLLLGIRLGVRASEKQLQVAFSVLIGAVAIFVTSHSVLAIATA